MKISVQFHHPELLNSVQFHRPEFLKSDKHPTLKKIFHKAKDDPIDAVNSTSTAVRMQALKQQSRASRERLLGKLVTISRNSPAMTELTEAILVPSPLGEAPQLNEKAWATLHDFDAKRIAGQILGNMPSENILQEVNRVAMDKDHPCHKDAELLIDIMTRPIDVNPSSLEQYLSRKVKDLDEILRDMEILPDPDPVTFNSIQPYLVCYTQDYNSIGRTLLFKGATSLIGIPSAPTDTAEALTPMHIDRQKPDTAKALEKKHLDRQERLQRTIFSFPTHPAGGDAKLTLSDFNAMIDPLDALNVYESSSPQIS